MRKPRIQKATAARGCQKTRAVFHIMPILEETEVNVWGDMVYRLVWQLCCSNSIEAHFVQLFDKPPSSQDIHRAGHAAAQECARRNGTSLNVEQLRLF